MLKLFFEMSNSAFAEGGASECARILRHLADRIEREGGLDYAKIRDVNGNAIGELQMSRVSED